MRAYSAKSSRTAASCSARVASTSLAIYTSFMRLHQLKVDYDAEQDRLLMLVATSEGVELRLSLTRRFVKLLWPLLVKLARSEEHTSELQSLAYLVCRLL